MANIEIRSVEGLAGSAVPYAYAVKADVQAFPGVQLAWSRRHGDAPHPFVCVQVPGELGAPRALLTADFWIYSP